MLLLGQSLLAQNAAQTSTVKPAAGRPAGNRLAAADHAYAEKNYAAALRGYRTAIRDRDVPAARRPLIDYRVARCLGFTEQWEAAFAETLRVANRYPATIWDARSRSWLMRLYLTAPHAGWKAGDRYYRGQDFPKVEGDAPAEAVDFTDSDQQKALQSGEQSKAVYERIREPKSGTSEEADLTADLTRVVNEVQLRPWEDAFRMSAGKTAKAADDPFWKVEPTRLYEPADPAPKKVLYLLENAAELADARQKPLARLQEALWLHAYHQEMDLVATRVNGAGEQVTVPFPYEDRDAVQALRILIRGFPTDSEARRARVMAADWLAEADKYEEALEGYRSYLKDEPNGKWAGVARHAEDEITRVVLNVEEAAPRSPGRKATLSIHWRNVPELKCAAHRVRLEDLVQDPRFQNAPAVSVSNLLPRLGGIAGVRKFYRGDALTWAAALSPARDYAAHTRTLETPLSRNGAYVVELDGGPVRVAVLLIITDLAVVQLEDRAASRGFVANAETGAPVFQANVILRQIRQHANGQGETSVSTAITSGDGLVEVAGTASAESTSVWMLAWKGDRYAFTSGSGHPPANPALSGTAYVYTDRPLYRPGQTVSYRALLATKPDDDSWKPLTGQKVRVRVQDPHGAEVDSQVFTSGDFGTLNGSLQLGSQPPLGVYSVRVLWGDPKLGLGRGEGSFRVEEYRKPEFQVTVEPGQAVSRVGEVLTARVVARYYFGAPVAHAPVRYSYTINAWTPASPFSDGWPGAADFDENNSHEADTQSFIRPRLTVGIASRPLAPPGTGTAGTGADGVAVLRIDTRSLPPALTGRHVVVALHAEVTDASRRTISADGEIRALATQFNAFLRPARGFYTAGDRLQVDVRTLDADGNPVAVAGRMRVLRVTLRDGKRQKDEIHVEDLRTDGDGRGTFSWSTGPDTASEGKYEFSFEARDAWEQAVTASTDVWVGGESAARDLAHDRHVQLVLEQGTYRVGQIARALLVADEPGLTVLLTREAGDRVLELREIKLTGKSQVVNLPLTRRDSPDELVAVTGVHDRQLFRSTALLRVPPVEQILHLEVSAEAAKYRPGDRARLHVRVRDSAGQPVQTECSIGVIDASLYYIQEELAPPLAGFFCPPHRGANLVPVGSFDPETVEVEADDQPPWKGQEPRWEFPSGLGNLPADVVNSLSGETVMGGAVGVLANPVPLLPAAPPPANAAQLQLGATYNTEASLAAVAVRSQFADTALWAPTVVTGKDGEATVEVTWPDNLTRWQVDVKGCSREAQVGQGSTEVTTAKDLVLRLQAPRFFVERDEIRLSANVHNYTGADRDVRVSLRLGGGTLALASEPPAGPPRPRPVPLVRPDRPDVPVPSAADEDTSAGKLSQLIHVPQGDERRVDWRVRVERPGDAVVRMIADAGAASDAVEMRFPVVVHGVEKLVTRGGAILASGSAEARSAKLTLDLPAERDPDSGELIVEVCPSAAATMLDALPYLVDYPYGCTEQTMSRFLPAVVCAKTLTDLGVDLEALRKRAAGAYEQAKNEKTTHAAFTGYTLPEGSPGSADIERHSRELWEWRAEKSPVYNPDILKSMVAAGLSRLRKFQHADGGWGWWQDDSSDEHMSAYVLQGLITAKSAGIAVPLPLLEHGFAFLERRFRAETGPHERTYLGWVLTLHGPAAALAGKTLLEEVFPKRDGLNATALAYLALALHRTGHQAEASVCVQNLENTARIDRESGTCNWVKTDGSWWRWYNDDMETASTCLRALISVDPGNRLTPMVVKWLANKRAGEAWRTTRETALAIEALAGYVKANQELEPDYTVTVNVDGQFGKQFRKQFRVTADNALQFDNRIVIPASALGSGTQIVTITREGTGHLYYNAWLRYFTLEEGIRASGTDIRVRRRYFRLTRPTAETPKDTALTPDGYVRAGMHPGDPVTSGDLLEVELALESKDSYEYLVLEDMKPSGCEPVELRSGTRCADGLCSDVELRDEKVAFFISHVAQGRYRISYRLRAEIPGRFHVLPVSGYAMYAPALRCISDEDNFTIRDAPSAALP